MTFSRIEPYQQDLDRVKNAIKETATRSHLVLREQWIAKVLQLYQIQQISHGIMLVGGTATGKTRAWRTLLQAMDQLDGKESVSYLIDPKAISKDSLYGTLDVTTREWTDGLFTSILRKILEDARGESSKRHFIVFDGDVDPEWIENLNR
jgi:dynein heavy chain 1